jgi:hypothetical protein
MNVRESENYLAISRSSSASKSVEIFWAEIYDIPRVISLAFNGVAIPQIIKKFLTANQLNYNSKIDVTDFP